MARQRDWTLRTRATLLARLKDIDDHKSWTEFYGIYSHLIYGVARQRGLTGKTIDLRNSGDTAGPRDKVVGYGAYVFDE